MFFFKWNSEIENCYCYSSTKKNIKQTRSRKKIYKSQLDYKSDYFDNILKCKLGTSFK